MAADTKAQAIFDASNDVVNIARQMRALATGVLQPVAGDVQPHADTIVAIKAAVIALYDEWDTAKAALDAAKTA